MKGVTVSNFYGGIPITQNKEVLKKGLPNVVIGTPGRIKQVGQKREREAACRPLAPTSAFSLASRSGSEGCVYAVC